jgi:predicted  nucleic acid-binding Zn-ribbon protein
MKWVGIGFRMFQYVVEAIKAIEAMVTSAKGEAKEQAAVGAVHSVLKAVEAGADRDLLNDDDVNRATRAVMKAVVELQNVIARKQTT